MTAAPPISEVDDLDYFLSRRPEGFWDGQAEKMVGVGVLSKSNSFFRSPSLNLLDTHEGLSQGESRGTVEASSSLGEPTTFEVDPELELVTLVGLSDISQVERTLHGGGKWQEMLRKQEEEDLAAQDAAVVKAQQQGLSKAQVRKIKNRMSAVRSRKRKEIEKQAMRSRLATVERKVVELSQVVTGLRRENKRLREERNFMQLPAEQAVRSVKRRRLDAPPQQISSGTPNDSNEATSFSQQDNTVGEYNVHLFDCCRSTSFDNSQNTVDNCSMDPGHATSNPLHRKCGTPMPSGTRATPVFHCFQKKCCRCHHTHRTCASSAINPRLKKMSSLHGFTTHSPTWISTPFSRFQRAARHVSLLHKICKRFSEYLDKKDKKDTKEN